jgi:hypothetical protein
LVPRRRAVSSGRGLFLALAALAVLALTGEANAIVVFAIGAALWLAGHWHYALLSRD